MEERRSMQESVVKKHRQVLVRHADENLANIRKKLPEKQIPLHVWRMLPQEKPGS